MITDKTLTTITQLLSALGHTDVDITVTNLEVLDTPVVSFTLTGIPKSFEDSFYQSLHHLVRELVAKEQKLQTHEVNLIIDHNNKLANRIKELKTMAGVLTSRATAFGTSVHCEPMTSLERKILHTLLQSNPNITSESDGEGSERHIVIKVK